MLASVRHRRPGLAGLTAALIVALPLVVASPAQAVTRCGATKNVRVSIYYTACDSDETSAHAVAGFAKIQNNHGSAVSIRIQDGYTVNGGSIQWNPNTPSDRTVPAGASKVAGWPGWAGCHQGDTIGYVLRVWDNRTGAWGPGSFATPVTCP
ncbi:hypothetical protein ACTOB_004097 [Actinoplanes oblitus]|uniref:Secreted protein n=1 Tax=Actinoplanes oblitus TaxID=3040509 RepID=A0ABY8WU67_9ACTN|nr:hypothetical protein [Actinoplanes oblitus]WIN00393.1 hypothetical protein ACTOB_004097 [Actinoplanes oblitus]